MEKIRKEVVVWARAAAITLALLVVAAVFLVLLFLIVDCLTTPTVGKSVFNIVKVEPNGDVLRLYLNDKEGNDYIEIVTPRGCGEKLAIVLEESLGRWKVFGIPGKTITFEKTEPPEKGRALTCP